ncbi:hypothetical protein AYR62_11990 [Secundilactobacillus paracollinoides]|uniref:Uncharacterized protein n=1 Tax=Secundilactobacillus paracollinoides TaxID=240427 RepID=A0A1B2IXM2_9LACO|nr:hypothetical protein AYR61_05865 [Secundilactobacillus paracollinoides]ANZ64726.1 hypothetical protein AYR62_11990 [Secundilactobacillus paracollinoides]ANZ66770.1 hypothetical protein AYR63_06235 [Secundilactobacillus paracollinoides]KRL80725.1 hypothetical protein FC17_GL003088 [Secundilactobacillus paracollinoides DSM 15502 = JCM 11969]
MYTDLFFEKGHWGLKIKESLVALFGLISMIVPIVMTGIILTHRSIRLFGVTIDLRGGMYTFGFLGIILLFCFAVTAVFAISMVLIQNRKRERLIEQWPTFDPLDERNRETELTKFMTKRFGEEKFRQNVRLYRVQPEQNLDTHELAEMGQVDKDKILAERQAEREALEEVGERRA